MPCSSGKSSFSKWLLPINKSTSPCSTGFMISKSQRWFSFLALGTNQPLLFHKFSGLSIKKTCFLTLLCILYRQTVTVLLSVTIHLAPKPATRTDLRLACKSDKSVIYSLRYNDPEPTRKAFALIIIPFSPSNITGTICRATFPGRGTLAASTVTPQVVGLAAPFVDVSPVAACGGENVSTEGFNCDNSMTTWSCGWFRGTHPSTGYVPYSLIMSTIQLHVLFWGAENTNPVSPPITIVNSHLISLHTKHSNLAPEFAWVSLRAFSFLFVS